MAQDDLDGSLLMKAVETVAISPTEARALAERYEMQFRATSARLSDREITDLTIKKIINRYCKFAAAVGGTTSLTGVVPGIGTAIALVGGGMADVTACMKLQIDMTMCLCMAINKEMTNEDAKHMAFVIALAGSLEGLAQTAGSRTAAQAAAKVVENTLKNATLTTVKQLFKLIGVTFTKKAFMKVLPFGIGVVVGSSTNYVLTLFVGRVARDVLWAEHTRIIDETGNTEDDHREHVELTAVEQGEEWVSK
jgi:hypothetical protein